MDSFPKEQDRHRDREIYRYLFSLAVVYRGEAGQLDDPKNINFNKTALKFGEKADYARRIYNFITSQDHDGYNLPSKITTSELVERLGTLLQNLEPGTIRREDISKLFGYLISLTAEERKVLNLAKSEADVLLQQSFLNMGYYNANSKQADNKENKPNHLLRDSVLPENILNLYKASLDLQAESDNNHNFRSEEKISEFIRLIIDNHLEILGLSGIAEEKKSLYFEKIQRRINRIIAQSGFSQLIDGDSRKKIFANYFSPKFIKNLTITTIDNDLIRDKIPLYLEYIDVERIEPLPLYMSQGKENLLNKELQQDNLEIALIQDASLASLYAYRVTLCFNLAVETKELKDKENIPPEVRTKLFNNSYKSGVIFKVDSTGVGTQLPQIIKIINRALFWDVKCIEDRYFAIAHDLVHEVIGNQISNPVWSHSLVRLCRLEYLEQALRNKGKYIDYAHIEEVARGDYLGFSLLEASAKSALQARLAAILQANIHPERYKRDLTETIIRREVLRVSDNFLDYYPFSLSAMEGFLKRYKYLKENLSRTKKHSDGVDENNEESDPSSLYYDAYLSIIKAYLREGLYRKAKRYFDEILILEEHSRKNLINFRPDLVHPSKGTIEDCEIFSGGSLAKYEILKAYYLYLFDEEDKEVSYRWPGIDDHRKANLISKAWDCLDNASHHLQIRIAKYAAINEISQAIFYPYFITLAHIHFRQAKLFLYFPTDSANRFAAKPELKNYHYARLYFFEQACLYAAKQGNQVTYAIFTSLQVWAYIMAGYLEGNIIIFSSGKSINLTRNNCLQWAKDLRDRALVSYTEYGRKCYYEIKEKSGISDSAAARLPDYGPVKIDPVPLIREERSHGHQVAQGYGYFEAGRFVEDGILRIDMELLHMKELDNSNNPLEEAIYLFGTKAANLLFARGMCELCDDDNISTIDNWKAKITKAYRLFTYAWAIAEDGGKTEVLSNNQYQITRPDFTRKVREDAQKVNYPPPEALSVRDIYPHRQTEMSDMGKVFAIASLLLLMYLTKTTRPLVIDQSVQKIEEYESEINQLIAHFHLAQRCNPDLIAGQKYFNGHLRFFLKQIAEISREKLADIHDGNLKYPLDVDKITQIRDKLLKQFFSALQKRS